LPPGKRFFLWAKDFDSQGKAPRVVTGMACTTVTARACRKSTQQIDLGKELDEVSWPHRARLHEVLMRVPSESAAHEDIQNIMDVSFHLRRG